MKWHAFHRRWGSDQASPEYVKADWMELQAAIEGLEAELTRLRAVAESAEPLLDIYIDALAYHSARIRLRYCLDAWKEGR